MPKRPDVNQVSAYIRYIQKENPTVKMLHCAAAFVLAASPCLADTMHFHAVMAGSAEVPPTSSPATGVADATLDTASGKLTWTISWQGLKGPATMAHFHGPAAAGTNASVVVKLGMKPVSPIKGTTMVAPTLVSQLQSGLWYANVHTAEFPKGAIRGQLLPVK
jgi:hypothetical protein